MAERYSLARSSYSEAIKLCPNNSTYYRNRCNCFMMLGDFEEGLKDSQMVISLDSQSEDGYNCMIKCCLALGDIDNAMQAINKLIEISSNNSISRRYVERCEQLRSLLVMATKCFEEQDIRATGKAQIDEKQRMRTVKYHFQITKISKICLQFIMWTLL